MKKSFLVLLIITANLAACAQSSQTKLNTSEKSNVKVGGSCEGCEAIYECDTPFNQLKPMVWLPDWNDKGIKLAVNGTVYKADGTPAPDVIIYIYHTDQTGVYPTKGDEKGW